MKNEQIFKNPELIPLLIKYVEVNKIIFPIEKVNYLSNEEIIKILKDCINNQIAYNPNYELVKKITLLEDTELKTIYPLIKLSMEKINYDYMKDVKDLINSVNLRKKGKKYTFEEHLKALIIAGEILCSALLHVLLQFLRYVLLRHRCSAFVELTLYHLSDFSARPVQYIRLQCRNRWEATMSFRAQRLCSPQ